MAVEIVWYLVLAAVDGGAADVPAAAAKATGPRSKWWEDRVHVDGVR
ncbi:hypothetical protein [Streptomyces platensis]